MGLKLEPRDLIEAAGILLIAIGVALAVTVAVGLVVLGAGCVLFGLAMGR